MRMLTLVDYARDSGYGGYVSYSIPVRRSQRRTEVGHTSYRLLLLGRVEVMGRVDVGVGMGGSGAIGV